jgi:hypothetical protein
MLAALHGPNFGVPSLMTQLGLDVAGVGFSDLQELAD